jgi:hypothetical protein
VEITGNAAAVNAVKLVARVEGIHGGETNDSFPSTEPIPTGIANGRYGANLVICRAGMQFLATPDAGPGFPGKRRQRSFRSSHLTARVRPLAEICTGFLHHLPYESIGPGCTFEILDFRNERVGSVGRSRVRPFCRITQFHVAFTG